MRKVVHVQRQILYRNSVFSSQFSCELRTALKKKQNLFEKNIYIHTCINRNKELAHKRRTYREANQEKDVRSKKELVVFIGSKRN